MALDTQTDDPALRSLGAFNNDASAPTTQTDDPALRPLGAFNTDAGVTTFQPRPAWYTSDLPKGLSISLHEGVGAPLAEITGQTEEAEAERQSAAQTRQTLTPGAEQTWPVFLSEQAAPTAALLGPGLALGVAGAPAALTLGAGVVIGGAIQGGGAISENKEAINQADDTELQQNNPSYAEDRKTMSETEAKAKLGSDMALSVGAPSALIGGALGAAGGLELGGLLKMGVGDAENAALTGQAVGKGLTRRVSGKVPSAIVGAGRGLVEMGVPGAAQEAVSKHAEAQEGVGQEATSEDILQAGVGQGLFGAVVGAGGGFIHGKTRLPQGGKSAEPTRSQTDYQKPEAPSNGGKPPTPVTSTAPEAAPTEPTAVNKGVDPTVAAALPGGGEAAPVTPGVTKPPEQPVKQPEVVQPTPPPPETAREAPPAGDTTGEPQPPQPPPEAGPAPIPAPPVEDVGANTPEPQASLAEQHAALIDRTNDREAMVYPKGEQPIDITDQKGFGQVKLPDGRIVQYDKAGPSGFTAAKIRQYAKDDRLNEALGLGPVSKDEALSRTLAGEPGAVVTERTPDGTEVKGAVGTTATVPDQVASLEASKTPGNSVQAEDVGANHAAQLDHLAREQAVQQEVAQPQAPVVQPQVPVVQPEVVSPTSEITPRVSDGRNVLPDISPEGIRARDAAVAQETLQAQSVQDQLKAKEAAAQEAAPKRVHTAKTEQAKITADNIAAKRISDAHPAPPILDNVKRPTVVYDRAKAMVNEAKAAGIKIPDAFPEGHPHSPAMLKLREAVELTSKKEPKWDAYARFLDREKLIDAGKGDEAFETRRNEGALGRGSPEGATEEQVVPKSKLGTFIREAHTPETELMDKQEAGEEHEEGGGGGDHEDEPFTPSEVNPIAQKMHEEWLAKSPEERAEISRQRNVADLKDELRRLELIQRGKYSEQAKALAKEKATSIKEKLAEKGASKAEIQEVVDKVHKPYISSLRPTTDTGAKVEVRKSRSIKRQMEDEQPGKRMMADEDGNPQEVTVSRTTTAREAIAAHYDANKYARPEQQMNERLIEKVNNLAGDTPVHYIDYKDMQKLGGGYGFYDPHEDHIVLATFDGEVPKTDTALHEVFHAATAKALEADPHLGDMMKRLRDDVRANMGSFDLQSHAKLSYALSDPEEFLTGMMTNPDVQRLLKGVKISDELARDLGIPRWRKMTAWEGALNVIRQALRLGPRDVSAIEAAMSLSEQAMWQHPLMEAMGRRARADEGAAKPSVSLPKLRFQREAPPEEQAKGMAEDAQNAVQKPSSFWNSEGMRSIRSGTKELFTKGYIKGAMTDVLRIDNEHLFGDKTEANPMRRAQEGLLKQGHMIQNMLKGHNDLLQRMANMKRANPDGLERIVSLLSESHDFNVHPDVELGSGLNDYIKPNPKTGEYDETTNRKNFEAIHAHERLSDDFNNSTPEEQKLFQDMRDTFMEEGAKSVKANIETFTQGVKDNFDRNTKLQEALKTPEANRTPSEIKQVERYNAITKALNGEKLNEGDEHDTYHDDPHIQTIRDLRGMLKQEGPHFPGTRKGGWVVNAEHELPEAPNALETKDNTVTFGSEKEAFDYQRELVGKSLPSDIETVREPVSSDQKPGQGGDKYKVVVQNTHSSATNDIYEGRILGDKLKAMGLKNVTEPMLREKNESIDYGLHSGTLRAMDHAVDALTHLSKEEKNSLKEANEQAALGLMKGNRMNRGFLKSNRVRGANADPVLAMHDYLANSARTQARSKTLPDIDKAFQEMREHKRNVQDENTPKRGMLVQEMEDRSTAFGKDGFTGQTSPALQKITTLAYLKDMMAPIHFALDLTHPYLQSIPHMAGRHGFGSAHATYAKSLGDMGAGGTLGKGVKGLFSALKGADHQPTDLMTGIRNNLVKNGATADELRAFDVGRQTPHLGSIVTDFSKSFDRTGGLDRGAAYLQGIGNEMSHAVDAVNRVATYMTAYKLERAKMGKANTLAENVAHHAQAVRYAKDTVSQTQGIYSASNRSSFMRNPAVRAAMQFRSVPMMIYRLLAKNMYNAVKGETPEIRRGAVISLVSTMGTTAALAGAASGVPEPIRLAVEMGHALGINNSWQEYQDQARRYTDAHMGKFGSRLLMDGILGAAGLNTGNRIGLQDLMIKDQALQSPKDFALEMAGAPFGYGVNDLEGVNDMLGGNYSKGIPKLLPIRLLSDVAKAYIENQGGKQAGHGQPDMKPLDPFETFIKAAGGTPTREALYGQETSLLREASTEKKNALQKAVGGNRNALSAWNTAHPHDRITQAQVLRGKQTKKIETPKQKQVAEDYSVYQ